MPVVSVAIPTFQRRELVVRAAASVLAQTFRDFELIVVDDGSDDGTREALAALGGAVRYLWQPNRGVSAARNAGSRLARGEVVVFLDSDDRWLPEHLGVVVEALGRNPEAVLASTCPGFSIGGREHPRGARLVDALPLVAAESLPGYPSGVAVRRAELLAAGGFDERLVIFEDRDLWLRLARRGPFALVRRQTIVRRRTPGSLRERGSRDGLYPAAFELSAERELAELPALPPGPRRDAARAAGEARLRFARALLALEQGDEERTRAELAAACGAHPGLSDEPELVAKRIALATPDPQERRQRLAAVGRLWPDEAAATARSLAARARESADATA